MTSLVTKHLAGLFNGVSQQAPTLRLETQAQKQINGLSSLVEGLKSRPATTHVSRLLEYGDANSLYHPINRDIYERYIVGVHAGGGLTVHDIGGYKYPIVGLSNHTSYLSTSTPRNDLAITTIADYTLLVNKKQTVETELIEYNSTVQNPAQAVITCNTVGEGQYSITVDGTTIASTTGYTQEDDGQGGTTNVNKTKTEILMDLRDLVNSQGLFSATYVTNETFTFRLISGESFSSASSSNIGLAYTPSNNVDTKYDTIAYIYVAKGVAEQNYRVYIDDVKVAEYKSGKTDNADTYKTDVISSNLYSQLIVAGYNAERNGSVIKVWKLDGSDFEFYVTDSWGDIALKGFKGRAQSFKDLPPKCFDGAVLEIAGKTDSDEGTYWVSYETSYLKDGEEIQTTGVWKESREPNKRHKLNADTLPVQMVRRQNIDLYSTAGNPDGLYFSVEPVLWGERKVGDETSAPAPSFVGRTINDIFLFNNRLGLLSGQSVILSKVGDFFNFFPTTVTDVLDDDPIDIDAPSLEVTDLFHALPSREHLMLFSANQQFILNSGGEPLTVKTANITSILQYPCDTRVSPVPMGQMAYYVSPRGDYSSIREYFIQSDGVISDAPNVTDHVPWYLPNKWTKSDMCGIPNEDLLLLTTGSKEVYVYKFNWVGDQKTQSSWSTWVFNKNILTIQEFDNKLYVLFENGCLEYLDFAPREHEKLIDGLKLYPAGDAVSNFEGSQVYDTDYNLVETLGAGTATYAYDVLVGAPFEFVYEFSPMYLKLSQDGLGEVEGKSLLRRVLFYLQGTTNIKLTVKDIAHDKDRVSYLYKTPISKALRYTKSFLLRGDSKETTVEIKSVGQEPVNIQSASFELLVNQRSKSI